MLINWQELLQSYSGFSLFKKHSLKSMNSDKKLHFDFEGEDIEVSAENIILALGGGSWKKTGSDGKWTDMITKLGIEVSELRPMNCGFEVNWSDFFKNKFERGHLKNIRITHGDRSVRAEVMLTTYGIEGSAIYALSNFIRDDIESSGKTVISIDLKPDLSIEEIENRFKAKKSKESMSTFLKKSLKLDPIAIGLINENGHKASASRVKNCEVELRNCRPIDEAISTSGGVLFSVLSDHFESKKVPGLFFVGEMLDFEAPTGGYLLQGCFCTAHRACQNF